MATATGTHALVARAIGGNKPIEAAEVTLLSTIVAIIFGVTSTSIFFIAEMKSLEPLGLMSLSEIGCGIFADIAIFVPGLAILFIVGAALRAAGDVITPLIINLIVNVINVFLLIALVNGQFGFEAMGVVGRHNNLGYFIFYWGSSGFMHMV